MNQPAPSFVPIETDLLVAVYDAAGQLAFRNAPWQALFGSSEDPWHHLDPMDRDEVEARLQEALSGTLLTHQIVLLSLPGQEIPLPTLLNFIPVPPGEGPVQGVTITGEVLAQPTTWTATQTHRQRLESLGRMAMGVAHDFNNLLSSILGHAELLKAAMQEHAPVEDLALHVRTIEQAALGGATLVRKIQQYLRQEKQTAYEFLDLPSLIHDAVNLTRPYWYNEPRREGITINVRFELDEVAAIRGSEADLRDVLVNLILNAVQAMPEGGLLTFRATDEDGGVVLRVTDTGTGMTEQVRQRIFDPLYTTKGERGNGMGLAIARGTLRQHDGSIHVASSLGVGTTFTLVFPSAMAAAGKTPGRTSPTARATDHQAAHLLLVDDEPMVLQTHARLLRLKGHRITEATSAQEALSLLDNHTFDLIVTDQGMPEMNGRQLAAAIRPRFPDLPILLLTGDTNTGQPDATITAILNKPIPLADLEAAIQNALAG